MKQRKRRLYRVGKDEEEEKRREEKRRPDVKGSKMGRKGIDIY